MKNNIRVLATVGGGTLQLTQLLPGRFSSQVGKSTGVALSEKSQSLDSTRALLHLYSKSFAAKEKKSTSGWSPSCPRPLI